MRIWGKASRAKIDLQTKIVFVLLSVIVPVYIVATVVQNQVTRPLLEQELRQLGITAGEALAAELVSSKVLFAKDNGTQVERVILERLYLQPSIIRMEVFLRDGETLKLIASSVDEPPAPAPSSVKLSDKVSSEFVEGNEDQPAVWEIVVPIKPPGMPKRTAVKPLGAVHLLVSVRAVDRVQDTLWRVTWTGALVSVVILVVLLNFFLRKTIANERLLRRAETQNIQLAERLHEAQRQMMNVEKLAVMGELTASFAHEIGTPLNAIGGHLQLLKEEITPEKQSVGKRSLQRFDIIADQVGRIESIVKNFLQTTAKPPSQRQLVDVNSLIDKAVGILMPRAERLAVDVNSKLDRALGPLRAVPTDIEQILLNLTNNSLDSLEEKRDRQPDVKLSLQITSRSLRKSGREWLEIAVYDSGMGIKRSDLKNIVKPFFTTKRPGEGTGLGLSICRQLAGKYGAILEIDSKEGAWAEFRVTFPYDSNE